MGELLKWLSEHAGVLALLLSLFVLSWAFFIGAFLWALKTGGEASLWLFKVKGRTRIVGVATKLRIEAGSLNMPPGLEHEAFYNNVQKSKRTCAVLVPYTEPFKKKPQIFLALSKIDLGGSVKGEHIDRLLLKTEDEHTDSVRLVFETWDDSIVYDAAASWIAVGE
jgi:hypothetical protein